MPPPQGPPWTGGPAGPQQPPGQGRRSKRLWWGGIAAVLVLAAGGTAAALTLNNSTPANAAQAVALNGAITAPQQGCSAPAGASAGRHGGRGTRAGHQGCLKRQLHEIKGMYGQVAYHTSSGTQTLAFERGTVTADSGSQLTVQAANGTRWNWTLASGSVIRRFGTTVPASQLARGTRVFIGGQVNGSSRDARLVLVHRTGRARGGRSQWPSGTGGAGGTASGQGSSGAFGSGAGS